MTEKHSASTCVDPTVELSDNCQITITYTPAGSTRHRLRVVHREDGPGWWLIEDEWTGCVWRPIGREPVDDVTVTIDGMNAQSTVDSNAKGDPAEREPDV